MKTPILITALRRGLLLLLLACALHALSVRAQTPQYMTYQGYLTDQNGGALATNGPQAYSVVFRIWNQPTGGGTPLYGELQTVTVANGYFSVLLGQGSSYINLGVTDPRPPLSTVFTTNNSVSSARYVEMTVKGIGAGGADVTILPRLQLVSAPYAFLAGNANALVSSTTGTNIITSSGNTITVNGNENVLNSVAVTGSSNPSLSVNDGTSELDLALALASGSWSLGASAHDAVVRNTNGKLILQSGSGNPGLVLDTANNLGIGTTTPAGPLNIKELTGTVAGANNGTIVLDHADPGGASSIVFRSKNNRGSDFGYIQYQDDSTLGGSGEASLLTIGVQNDVSQDNLALLPAGNVGVGTTSPSQKLDVSGNINASGFIAARGTVGLFSGDLNPFGSATFEDNVSTPRTHYYAAENGTGVFNVGSGGSTYQAGSSRIVGTVRMGTEGGTSEGPNQYGMITRRINSTTTTAGSVVARDSNFALERDGTPGGLRLHCLTSINAGVVASIGINYANATVNNFQTIYPQAAGGLIQVLNNANHIGHCHISFGDPWDEGHMTEVTLTRFADSSNDSAIWIGTVTSTYNQ